MISTTNALLRAPVWDRRSNIGKQVRYGHTDIRTLYCTAESYIYVRTSHRRSTKKIVVIFHTKFNRTVLDEQLYCSNDFTELIRKLSSSKTDRKPKQKPEIGFEKRRFFFFPILLYGKKPKTSIFKNLKKPISVLVLVFGRFLMSTDFRISSVLEE